MDETKSIGVDQEIDSFVKNHGVAGYSDYYLYYITMGLYYAYYIDALRFAEMIDDGEVFDEVEVGIVVKNLQLSKKTFVHYKSLLNFNVYEFDTNETVTMEECSLEKGHIVGKKENAIGAAKKWISRFKSKYAIGREPSPEEKSISQDFFLYEVAVYILFLLDEEVDYWFIVS